MNNIYSEYLSVALVIQHVTHIRRIVICGLSDSTIFSHNTSQTEQYSGKKVIEHKMCFLIFTTTFV